MVHIHGSLFYVVADLATIYGVCKQTVNNWIQRDLIAGVVNLQIGRGPTRSFYLIPSESIHVNGRWVFIPPIGRSGVKLSTIPSEDAIRRIHERDTPPSPRLY